jgi:hypothetical protein
MVADISNLGYLRGGRDKKISSSKPDWAKLVRPYLKNKSKNTKMAKRMIQVVEVCVKSWVQSPVPQKKKEKISL